MSPQLNQSGPFEALETTLSLRFTLCLDPKPLFFWVCLELCVYAIFWTPALISDLECSSLKSDLNCAGGSGDSGGPTHWPAHQGEVPGEGGGGEGPDLRPSLPADGDRGQDLLPWGDEERDIRQPAGLQGAQPAPLTKVNPIPEADLRWILNKTLHRSYMRNKFCNSP